MIGLVLIADGFGFHVPKGYIYAAMGFSIGALWVLPGLLVIPFVGWLGDSWGFRWGLLVLDDSPVVMSTS